MPFLPPSKADSSEVELAHLYQRRAVVDQLIRTLVQYNRLKELRRLPASAGPNARPSDRRMAS